MAEIQVEHDEQHRRYVAVLDDAEVGELLYRDTTEGRVFTHSAIDPAQQHQGFGTHLVRAALDDTLAAGLKPIGQCSMVRNFLAEHPDYARTPGAARS